MFEYHTFLHHSQTLLAPGAEAIKFEYHTFLHHSQTDYVICFIIFQFEYHTFLHHSQTVKHLVVIDIIV